MRDELDAVDRQMAGEKLSPPTSALSFRLTDAERSQLERLAGDLPLSAFIRSRIFDTPVRAIRTRVAKPDHRALGQVLGMLGQSGLASSLAQLARAANTGALLVDEETQDALNAACADIAAMRAALMQALGVRNAPSNPEGPR